MTRASEFCYIAERAVDSPMEGMTMAMPQYLSGMWFDQGVPRPALTLYPDNAMRITDAGRAPIQTAFPHIGFRKVLAG